MLLSLYESVSQLLAGCTYNDDGDDDDDDDDDDDGDDDNNGDDNYADDNDDNDCKVVSPNYWSVVLSRDDS